MVWMARGSLGFSWALLQLSKALLGLSWVSPVISWGLLGSPGAPWAPLGSPRVLLKLSWGSPGTSLVLSCVRLGSPEAFLELGFSCGFPGVP